MANKELTSNEAVQLDEMVERESLPEQSFSVEVVPEEKLREISRGSFFLEIDRQLERWQENHLEAQLRIIKLRDTIAKVRKAEFRGMRVCFFETEDAVFFKAEEKEPAGFVRDMPKRENSWGRAFNERQRKKE